MSDIDLQQYLSLLRKWLWLIIAATCLAALASYYATRSQPSIYSTSITLLVGDEAVADRVSLEDMSASQRIAAVYANMVRRQPVMEGTVRSLGLAADWRELSGRVLPIRRDGSQLLEIRVADTDPQRARAVADEVARQLILQSPTVQNAQDVEQRREFVRRQLAATQTNIQRAEASLAEKQDALAREVSTRGVLDLQDEIGALQLKIESWQKTYASLLTSVGGRSPAALTVVEPAFVPSRPVGPNVRSNVLMAGAVGGLLAVGTVLLIECVINGNRLSSEGDVTRVLDLTTLGSIGASDRPALSDAGLITVAEPDSAQAEAYRVLRSNVRFASHDDEMLLLLVTSPGFGEGKTVTSANLAASFARAGDRTILVDANLRHPTLHELFKVNAKAGLSTLLTRDTVRPPEEPGQLASVMHLMRQRLERYLVPTGVPGLSLLPAGPATEVNPGELAAAPEMGQLLEVLRTAADVVILDSAPVLPVADTAIMASKGLSVLLVVDAGRTRNDAARNSSEVLLRAQARVLGTVLNRTAHSGPRFFHFGAPDLSEVEPRWEAPLRFLFSPRPDPGPAGPTGPRAAGGSAGGSGSPGVPGVEAPDATRAER